MERTEPLDREYFDIIDSFLAQSEALVMLTLSPDLTIATHNPCFEKIIASPNLSPGKDIRVFLMPESQGILPLCLPMVSLAVCLNFKSQDASAIPLECHITRLNDGRHLILGGRLMLSSDQILQKMTLMSNEVANLARDLHRKNRELKEAHSKIKILSGIIPICMYCKEVRDDKGYWEQVEFFISDHSEAQFSHSICPKCYAEQVNKLNDELSCGGPCCSTKPLPGATG